MEKLRIWEKKLTIAHIMKFIYVKSTMHNYKVDIYIYIFALIWPNFIFFKNILVLRFLKLNFIVIIFIIKKGLKLLD